MPPEILEGYKSGKLPRVFFSDLLRLELLLQRGGTWLDSTVYCSGALVPPYMLDSDLFTVQTTPLENHIVPTRTESFFITARPGNPVLRLCRELIYAYLKDYDFLLDYYLFYHCLEIAIETMPDEWSRTVYEPRADIFALADEVYGPMSPEKLRYRLEGYPFHKLSYKESYTPDSALSGMLERGLAAAEAALA